MRFTIAVGLIFLLTSCAAKNYESKPTVQKWPSPYIQKKPASRLYVDPYAHYYGNYDIDYYYVPPYGLNAEDVIRGNGGYGAEVSHYQNRRY